MKLKFLFESEPEIIDDEEDRSMVNIDTIRRRHQGYEKMLLSEKPANTYYMYLYAKNAVRDRWPEAEPIIKDNPGVSFLYARDVVKDRWHEGEKSILNSHNLEMMFNYASIIIGGRWPEAEEHIKKDPNWAYQYAAHIIKGRWPEAEDTIKYHTDYACKYAINILGHRWLEAEEAIMRNWYAKMTYMAEFGGDIQKS